MTLSKFKLKRVSGQPVSDAELLIDLKFVAGMLNSPTVSQSKYREHGKFADSTIARRFGSWNNALLKAGLTLTNEVNISDGRLFENILNLWQHYGRQPRRRELAIPPSTISQGPYNRRFGSWSAALVSFIEYVNVENIEITSDPKQQGIRSKSGREPSLRLRWHVLQRDRYTCRACGTSPSLTPGVKLHVDHIVPWSKGGATVLENLQTLCSDCNLGKSNDS